MRKLAVIGKELCADGAKCDRFLLELETDSRNLASKKILKIMLVKRLECIVL
jgi:hypothetical protein